MEVPSWENHLTKPWWIFQLAMFDDLMVPRIFHRIFHGGFCQGKLSHCRGDDVITSWQGPATLPAAVFFWQITKIRNLWAPHPNRYSVRIYIYIRICVCVVYMLVYKSLYIYRYVCNMVISLDTQTCFALPRQNIKLVSAEGWLQKLGSGILQNSYTWGTLLCSNTPEIILHCLKSKIMLLKLAVCLVIQTL